jgi:hypothetical protein
VTDRPTAPPIACCPTPLWGKTTQKQKTKNNSNFMRKSRDDTAFWVIDFGIAKSLLSSSGQVRASLQSRRIRRTAHTRDHAPSLTIDKHTPPFLVYHLDPRRQMKAERASAEFRGTTMYAPVRAHQGRDLSFRSVVCRIRHLLCSAGRKRVGCSDLFCVDLSFDDGLTD